MMFTTQLINDAPIAEEQVDDESSIDNISKLIEFGEPEDGSKYESLPTCQDVRDENFKHARQVLLDAGYKERMNVVKCSDGEEYVEEFYKNKTREEELIEQGWEKEVLAIHIQEYDPQLVTENKFRRLSYDFGKSFTSDQITIIERFLKEVSRRFPNIKMFATGTGYVLPKKDVEEPSEEGPSEL